MIDERRLTVALVEPVNARVIADVEVLHLEDPFANEQVVGEHDTRHGGAASESESQKSVISLLRREGWGRT